MEEDNEILGYCSYCKDPIYRGEAHIEAVDEYGDKQMLHTDCARQSMTLPYELDGCGELDFEQNVRGY